jgi:4-amino-4-deoxy-L-arabinose transferase-like glycosyltransferase
MTFAAPTRTGARLPPLRRAFRRGAPAGPGWGFALLPLLLLFWFLTLAALDRSPRVNEGEALIVSLGYKLFTQGVYGTDLFAGFYGMERHYFLITPLMSLLQGANTRLLGMGLFQWRLLAAIAGMLTCALTYRVGRGLVGARAALLSVVLLIGWPWAHADPALMQRTGIPLMDVARLVRHDILVAPLGLAAWWAFLHQRRTGRRRYALLTGVLVGLAGLAHLYGLFWAAAFGLCLLVERAWDPPQPALKPALWIAAGVLLCWLPVAALIAPHRADFAAQALQSRSRFELLNLHFYAANLLNEVHRYSLGWRLPGGLLSPGAWTLVLGVPAAGLVLASRVATPPTRRTVARAVTDPVFSTGTPFPPGEGPSPWRAPHPEQSERAERSGGEDRGVRSALRLAAPALVFPLLFALLIEPKTYNYLVAEAPVFALLLAWGMTQVLSAGTRAARILVTALLAVVLLQGGVNLARAYVAGAQWPRPAQTYAQLRAIIPPGARVLGHQQYWPGLYDREFRSFGVAFMLAGPDVNPVPVSFRQALEQTRPEYVLLDPVLRRTFEDPSTVEAAADAEQFWAFMRAHDARRLTTLTGGAETPLEVYWLQW